jgi:hypothetical protein
MSVAPDVRELRSEIRRWRRGRADRRLVDVVSDAYIAVFSVVLLGAMGISVLIEVRAFAGESCATPACANARVAMPWLFALGLVGTCMGLSRLFGPVLVTPAVGSWLLPTPVDRAALLRPQLLVPFVFAFSVSGALAAAAATLGGFDAGAVASFAVATAATCSSAVALCAIGQTRFRQGVGRLATATALLLWCGLVALTADVGPRLGAAPAYGSSWVAAAAAAGAGAVALALAALSVLPSLGRAHLAPGGTLAPSLSGALAILDLALVYDVLLARRWRDRSRVSAVRRVPPGVAALVWRDVVRIRRSPRPVLVLAACLVVPYLAATVGMGRATVLVAATTGFLSGIGLFPALRVVARTPGLVRSLPYARSIVYGACLAVPGLLVLGWGLALTVALREALDVPLPTAALVGVAVGVTAVAAVTSWLAGAPPDYQMPLISSPAGAVPPALILSAARGFDVVLVVVAPLLFAPTATGATVSLVVGCSVLWWLLARPPKRVP